MSLNTTVLIIFALAALGLIWHDTSLAVMHSNEMLGQKFSRTEKRDDGYYYVTSSTVIEAEGDESNGRALLEVKLTRHPIAE